MAHTILIYHAREAAVYRDLLAPHLPNVRLITASTPPEAEAVLEQVDGIVTWRFPTPLLAHAPRLRWIQALGAGVEDLIAAPMPAHVQLTRVEGLFGTSMSEYAFAQMLAHTQQLRQVYADQAAACWRPFAPGQLQGKRLGVAGAGSIGEAVVRLGKGFGMEVWALLRTERPVPGADRLFLPAEAAAFTAGVDYLVSILPDTPQTRGLIDPRQMKAGGLLVNMGRGRSIDEGALLEATGSGRIHAVLDVFATEPLPPAHPLWRAPGITITPHIAGPSIPAEVAAYTAANYRRWAAGEPLVGLVDRSRGY